MKNARSRGILIAFRMGAVAEYIVHVAGILLVNQVIPTINKLNPVELPHIAAIVPIKRVNPSNARN